MKKSILKEKLKEILRPLVLKEITMDSAKASKIQTEPTELIKKLEKCILSVDSDAVIKFNQENGKIKIIDGNSGKKFSLEIVQNGDLFDVVAILDGSERLSLTATKFENIEKLIKETLKGRKDDSTYTEKAYKKSAIPEKQEKKVDEKAEKDSDESTESDEKKLKKQVDHKPLDIKERDIEEVTKGTAGMKDSTKFEKQVDIKVKDKVKLKADKKNNSEEKLTQKMDGTSKMKALKEEIKKTLREMIKEEVNKKKNLTESLGNTPNIDNNFINSLKSLESNGFKIEYGYAEYYNGSMTIQVRKDKEKNGIVVEQYFDNEFINSERASTKNFTDINQAKEYAVKLINSPFATVDEYKNKINEINNKRYIELTDEQIEKIKLILPEFDEYEIEYDADGEGSNDSFGHAFGTEKKYSFDVLEVNVKIAEKWYPVLKNGENVQNSIIILTDEQLDDITIGLQKKLSSRMDENNSDIKFEKIMKRGNEIVSEMISYAKSKGHL